VKESVCVCLYCGKKKELKGRFLKGGGGTVGCMGVGPKKVVLGHVEVQLCREFG
jgi:hypothetical protein